MGFTTDIQTYMNAGAGGTTSSRDAYHRIFENSLSWLKGSHSITIGGNYTQLPAVDQGAADRSRAAVRRRDRRSRRGDVQQRGELPWRLCHVNHRGAATLRDSDRPRQRSARHLPAE